MIVDEVLILLFKYIQMVHLLFNKLCISQNELIFVISNLFIGKRYSLKAVWERIGLKLYTVYQNSISRELD